MRFFVYCTYVPAQQLLPVAVAAEQFGFDGVSFPDHVIYPMQYESVYPYTPDGRATWTENDEWPDPLVVASAMAASTSTLQLMTSVFVLPARNPLLVAKAVATVDAISGGRFIFGIGQGWLREEFEVLGEEFGNRGRRTEEAIEVLRKVWTGRPVEHHGEFYDFPYLTIRPAPTRPIPIYIGGSGRLVLDRAARLGDGFLPPLTSQGETKLLLEEIRRRREECGRANSPFEVVAWGGGCTTPDQLAELGSLGVDAVRVNPFALYGPGDGTMALGDRLRALELYARELIQPLG